ncbi:MAG: hypothetical protein WD772_08455 [Pseudohongiellaceae bacterium]
MAKRFANGESAVPEALLVSNLVLWAVVILLGVTVFALARQVGILHERVAPAGALSPTNGPKAGEATSAQTFTALDGQRVVVGGAHPEGLLLLVLFISPTCPVCKTLVPTALALAHAERSRLRLVFASDGDALESHRRYVEDMGLTDKPYVVSQALGLAWQVNKLPFGVLIDGAGVLRAKGLVNTREHLDSLLEALDSGIATVQEFLGSRSAESNPRPSSVTL